MTCMCTTYQAWTIRSGFNSEPFHRDRRFSNTLSFELHSKRTSAIPSLLSLPPTATSGLWLLFPTTPSLLPCSPNLQWLIGSLQLSVLFFALLLPPPPSCLLSLSIASRWAGFNWRIPCLLSFWLPPLAVSLSTTEPSGSQASFILPSFTSLSSVIAILYLCLLSSNSSYVTKSTGTLASCAIHHFHHTKSILHHTKSTATIYIQEGVKYERIHCTAADGTEIIIITVCIKLMFMWKKLSQWPSMRRTLILWLRLRNLRYIRTYTYVRKRNRKKIHCFLSGSYHWLKVEYNNIFYWNERCICPSD